MQVASKKVYWKTTELSKHLQHTAIEKDIFSELNRCIFQISLKYTELEGLCACHVFETNYSRRANYTKL